MKTKHIVYALLIIGIGAFVFYRISANNTKKEAENDKGGKKPAANVSGIVLKPQAFADNLALSGSIEANESVDIRSEVSGIAESINFDEGASVSKGQILFKVNDIELRAQLGKTRTAQTLASENERRAKLLLQKEAISQEEYDIASADFKSAQSESQLINAQLAKTTIRAPFSGKIGLRSISKGTYVTPETVVAKLVNTTQVKITFFHPGKICDANESRQFDFVYRCRIQRKIYCQNICNRTRSRNCHANIATSRHCRKFPREIITRNFRQCRIAVG